MQENNFEHEVRQKLDELSLTPSEPVWQSIETAIKKKRKRRLIFWLVPFFALGGTGFWWLITAPQISKPQSAEMKGTRELEKTQPFSTPHAPETQTLELKKSQIPKSSLALSEVKREESIEISTFSKPHNAPIQNGETTGTFSKPPRNKKEFALPTEALSSMQARLTWNSSDSFSIKNVATQRQIGETRFINFLVYSFVQPGVGCTTISDSAAATKIVKLDGGVSTVMQPNLPLQKQGWQWHVAGRLGTSNFVEDPFSNSGMKSLPNASTGGGYQAGGSNSVYDVDANGNMYRKPAPATKGLHIAVGVGVQKRIGKRTAFITGLQYRFYRNHLTIGSPLSADSAAALQTRDVNLANAAVLFGNNAGGIAYTNRLHFIEVPLGLEYKPVRKLPLQLNTGIAVMQLFSSHVLQFDSRANLFYQDKSKLRKTGISLFAGADYAIWRTKLTSVHAGPFVQYSLQPLVKASQNIHIAAGGVALHMAF